MAFVDWNSQVHEIGLDKSEDHNFVALRALEHVCKKVSNALCSVEGGGRFRVSMRVYHGWTTGFNFTARRKATISAVAGFDFLSICSSRVLIEPNVEYGDRLLSARSIRSFSGRNLHLVNTYRRRRGRGEEKMVDTAIAADVVHFAHTHIEDWILVVGEDDDMVPPVLVAEAVRGARGGRTFLARKRAAGQYLKLENLQVHT